jgi:erythromycin esterase-like protein
MPATVTDTPIDTLHAALRREAIELGDLTDVEPVIDRIGDASLVLLGEATHGTHEFYRLRAEISQRLIAEHGFDGVAVEADWPDALRVNRFLRGDVGVATIDQALGGFERFPRWMWRNEEVRDFVLWLREHNRHLRAGAARAGFYGLDLYSLRESVDAVVRYLEQVDPSLAKEARVRYECFDNLLHDPQRYGYAARYGMVAGCEREVVEQLQSLLRQSADGLDTSAAADRDELFYAQQNALVVRNAERYYRTMFQAGPTSWNLRDRHMAETLLALREHLGRERGRPAKLIVWAHNSHLGDARATQFGDEGQLNLGQLVREQCAPGESFLLGFTTHTGSVAAASDWDEPVEFKRVRPSMKESVEYLLHDAGLKRALLPLRGTLAAPLRGQRLERALGVRYRPDTERWSHYFDAQLSDQFDAVIHVDETRAVTPLDRSTLWQPVSHEEETYPTGL